MNKKPEVEIISATETSPQKAAALLIFTKSTRLALEGSKLKEIEEKCFSDPEWMNNELEYMSKTIRSSWEFLDITFSLRNVSRACAQQITRTRFTPIDGDLFGSYAMQSQRVTDMSKQSWHNPLPEGETNYYAYDNVMSGIMDRYSEMLEDGIKMEDARGILPVNLHCSLVAKYNLRMLADLVQARASYRAQGEFNYIAAEMKRQLVEMWPWAEYFLRPRNEQAFDAVKDVEAEINRLEAQFLDAKELHPLRIALAKVNDLIQGK